MGAKRQGECSRGRREAGSTQANACIARKQVACKELRKQFGGTQKTHRPLLCSSERFKSASTNHFSLVLVNRADNLLHV